MRRRLSPTVMAAIGLGAVLLVALAEWIVPYATREREQVSGVPVPAPYFEQSSVRLGGGEQVCLTDVAFDTDSQLVDFTALGERRAGPPLEVSVETDDGYSSRAAIDGGYSLPARLTARIEPPAESAVGDLCIENAGRRTVGLLATADARTGVARPTALLDGEASPAKPSVRLLEADSGSVLDRAGQLVDRAAAFKPDAFTEPFLWLVLVLVVLGVPALAVYAALSSFRERD
jgi:hypothetical protein